MSSPRLHTDQALAAAVRSLSSDLWILLARPLLIFQNAVLILLGPNHFFRAVFDFFFIRHRKSFEMNMEIKRSGLALRCLLQMSALRQSGRSHTLSIGLDGRM